MIMMMWTIVVVLFLGVGMGAWGMWHYVFRGWPK